jgi:hypothetical protein
MGGADCVVFGTVLTGDAGAGEAGGVVVTVTGGVEVSAPRPALAGVGSEPPLVIAGVDALSEDVSGAHATRHRPSASQPL